MNSDAENIVRLYRRHAAAWLHQRERHLIERKWLDRLIAQLPAQPKVLDIGCGPGEPIARYLLETGCTVTGIDAAPEMIDIAKDTFPGATWLVSDMRSLNLNARFDGLLAWDSLFHLSPDDQRHMFPIFRRHADADAALMFTSGPSFGEAIGSFEGEPLYHATLHAAEYRQLLDSNGFDVVDHVVEDPECGRHTVWIGRFRSTASLPDVSS
ncbi:class I SAM-dependent methyltransferase [Bradyrhizobium diazoefficiens]|uniref:class I SAM-dependent methyltransferase n=1 Tax=Bradyrhizobium diazoefficiens TaxID=1355477 RepID=UPI00190A2923|nr:class I SAM-dependent methyltransferase [Bradyrhizobium diazoefficiens]MBK3659804.1 class I SAM-dependent methyltransferase [Bradyrhizobium diazoefficiens]